MMRRNARPYIGREAARHERNVVHGPNRGLLLVVIEIGIERLLQSTTKTLKGLKTITSTQKSASSYASS